MKRFVCWLFWFGHDDKPDVWEIVGDNHEIVYSWRCIRCGRVRWYDR